MMTMDTTQQLTDLISHFEAEAVASHRAGLLLFQMGRRDEAAMLLLDEADSHWRIAAMLKGVRTVERGRAVGG